MVAEGAASETLPPSDSAAAVRRSAIALAVNSGLAFACATLIAAALHEASHGLVAQALGFAPKIYAFVEDNPHGTALQDILILAGGPVGSLVLGVVFAWLYSRGRAGYSFGRFLLCWLAFCCITEFVNYLIITPWLTAGDTAVIADRLGWGLAPRYVVAVVGIVLLLAMRGWAARMMYAVAPPSSALDTPRERRDYIVFAFYLPAFVGLSLVALAGLGAPPIYVFYGTLAAFGSIDVVGVAMGAVRSPLQGTKQGGSARVRVEPLGIALYIALFLFYVFALTRGVGV